MKSIKTFTIFLAVSAALAMTSCLKSDNNGYSLSTAYPEQFNMVVDMATGETTLYPGLSLKVDWLYGPNTATLSINGLKLPGSSYPSLQFKDAPFTVNSRGWLDISMTDAAPNSTTGYISNLVFDDFKFQTISRQYAHNGQTLNFPPVVSCNYTINNQYKVTTLPIEIIEMGNSTITDQSGSQYKPDIAQNLTIYYIELDVTTKKGYIVIQGAKFAESMPALNMKFPDIPFEVSPSGMITMHKDEIVPTLMTGNDITAAGTPAPQFPISNLTLNYSTERGVQINYNCVPTGKDGQPMGKYNVNFVSEYPTSSNNSLYN